MTGFSPWAASLHLALCYARFLKASFQSNTVHVAVIDTQNLDDEVLVWHARDLLGEDNHEYLAFGRIKGNGYGAVSLDTLEEHSLKKIYRRKGREGDGFGERLRKSMLLAPAIQIEDSHLELIKEIGSLYGDLSFSVATALACLRSRIWKDSRRAKGGKPDRRDTRGDIFREADKLNIVTASVNFSREP
jgi:hypothetical protein